MRFVRWEITSACERNTSWASIFSHTLTSFAQVDVRAGNTVSEVHYFSPSFRERRFLVSRRMLEIMKTLRIKFYDKYLVCYINPQL